MATATDPIADAERAVYAAVDQLQEADDAEMTAAAEALIERAQALIAALKGR